MSDAFIISSFLAVLVFRVAAPLFSLIGEGFYNARRFKKQRSRLLHPYARRFRIRPLISIIMYAYNGERTIERGLESVLKSSYRKFEIIVVDDASSDQTKKVVADFISAHPKRSIKLVVKRKHSGRAQAVSTGFKKWARGELIMNLEAKSTIDKHALRNAWQHFAAEDTDVLATNVGVQEQRSLIGLVQQFEYLSRPQKSPAISQANSTFGNLGTLYHREVFARLSRRYGKQSQPLQVRYASNVVINAEPALSYLGFLSKTRRQRLAVLKAVFTRHRWLRLVGQLGREAMVFIEPFVGAYCIYLAVSFSKTVLYATLWASASFLLLFVVWTNTYLRLSKKFQLSLLTPVMYNLLLILHLIQLIAAVVYSLLWGPTLIGKKLLHTVRQSPKPIPRTA